PAAPRERVLVVPENVSPAWQATLVAEDGTALPDPRPVTVDGWKQGWVLPASGAGMTLELAVPAETPYRAALLTGPFALLLVLLLFLVRGADRAGAAARPWRARGLVTVAATAAGAGLVAGPAGRAITAGLGAGAVLGSRHRGADRARGLPAVAGTGARHRRRYRRGGRSGGGARRAGDHRRAGRRCVAGEPLPGRRPGPGPARRGRGDGDRRGCGAALARAVARRHRLCGRR